MRVRPCLLLTAPCRTLATLKGLAGDAGLTVAHFPLLAAAPPSAASAAAGSPNKRKRETAATHAVPAELQASLGTALAKRRAQLLLEGADGGGEGQQKRGRPPTKSATAAGAVKALPLAFRLADAFPPAAPPSAAAKPALVGSLASLGAAAPAAAPQPASAAAAAARRDPCAAALQRWRGGGGLDAAALEAELAAREAASAYPVEDAALPLEPPLPARLPPAPQPLVSHGGDSLMSGLTPEQVGQVLQVWDFVRVFASGEDALECSPEWCGDQLVASTGGRLVERGGGLCASRALGRCCSSSMPATHPFTHPPTHPPP